MKNDDVMEAAGNNSDAFSYQLLSRLQQDCEYYLGLGARNKGYPDLSVFPMSESASVILE